MRLLLMGLAALTTTAAGGIDCASLPLSILFDHGNHRHAVVFRGDAQPFGRISGAGRLFRAGTEMMAEPNHTLGFAFKTDLSHKLAVVVMVTPPYGADANDIPAAAKRGLWRIGPATSWTPS